MPVTSTRTVTVTYTGDTTGTDVFTGAANSSGPGGRDVPISLSSGFNSIPVPSGATGVTLNMPSANSVQLTLKGITGDTGVLLHLTNPTSLGLAAAQTTIGITAAGPVTIHVDWD